MMHLRVADLPLPKLLPNIYPRLWEGKWFPEGLLDFLAEDIEIRSDRKIPFQISGDAEGYRDFVRFSMWKGEIELLDFGCRS
jgi:diacylglycerol kinase family enzyme